MQQQKILTRYMVSLDFVKPISCLFVAYINLFLHLILGPNFRTKLSVTAKASAPGKKKEVPANVMRETSNVTTFALMTKRKYKNKVKSMCFWKACPFYDALFSLLPFFRLNLKRNSNLLL